MDFQENLFSAFSEPEVEKLCCFKNELQSVDYLSFEELFSGYDTIKAITFSYDLKFIDKLLEGFNDAKVIIGGNFLAEKDNSIQKLFATTLAEAYIAGQEVNKFTKLLDMLKNDRVEFKIPTGCIDHRKLYILSNSQNGKTRVITSSANMSSRAWKGDQIEHYSYDDSPFAFEQYSSRFDSFFAMCQPLPFDVITVKHTDDPLKANAYIKKVKEVKEVMVFQHMRNDVEPDLVKFAIDCEKIKGKYELLVGDTKIENKQGLIEISPNTIQKFELNLKKDAIKEQKTIQKIDYPKMVIDYENSQVFMDDEELNLNPTEDEVKRDIDTFLGIFKNFDGFVGDTEKIKHTHYKLLNAVFASPFSAKIRCTAFLKNISTTSLPMFLLAASSTANCGKTFLISAILKMMSGRQIINLNTESCKSVSVRDVQSVYKSLPVFIDEVNNSYISRLKETIKNADTCENNQLENQPMILFASNDVLEPDETLRKRMIFLRFEGALPSSVDQNSYKGMGNAIIKRLTNAFYREYLRRMLPKITNLLNSIIEDELEDSWYPDTMVLSSETILEILKDFGYEKPSYIRRLTFNDDYSVNANFIADNTLSEIAELYSHEKSAFKVTKNKVFIELGVDSDSKKKGDNWLNTLPAEMKAKKLSTKDKYQLVIDRAELEKRLGIKFGGAFSFFHWGK